MAIIGLLMMSMVSYAAFATLRPDSNGFLNQWSRTGCGSNYQCVDEATANTSDYLSIGVGTRYQTFGFQNLVGNVSAVQNVMLIYYAKQYDGNHTTMEPMVRINTSNYFGSVFNLTPTYNYTYYSWSTNPKTGLAWTVSDVNALEAGMRSSVYTLNGGGNVAQVYAFVQYT
jgi:hypothetical protein